MRHCHVYLQGFWGSLPADWRRRAPRCRWPLLLRSRVTHLRTIGKMGVVPNFFNINEPILFGAPIIMNLDAVYPVRVCSAGECVPGVRGNKLGWLAQVVSLTPWTTPAPLAPHGPPTGALSPG